MGVVHAMNGTEKLWTGLGAGIALGFVVAIGMNASGDEAEQSGPDGPDVVEMDVSGENIRHTPVTRAVERVAPSVVSITTEQPPSRLFGRAPAASSDGSGVVIDTEGVVLTNAHVVSSASRIIVSFDDGVQTEARVIGLAENLDLAVLKIPIRPELKAVEIGSSDGLLLGEPVIAIGNPFGLGHTVTSGVVSATSRALETDDRVFQDFIQTDASINPGNSGGPLLDRDGALVGITTSIRPDAQGIGFAIPIDRAIKVARDLVEVGAVRMPWLGASLEDIRLSIDGAPRVAPRVSALLGSDDRQGLQAGDFITYAGGRSVQGRADLNAYLAGLSPGEDVSLQVIRQSEALNIRVQTTEFPGSTAAPKLESRVGLRLAKSHGGRALSVLGVAAGSASARLGLRRGDLILAIDGARVTTEADFYGAALSALSRHRSSVLITVRRGRAQGRVALPL